MDSIRHESHKPEFLASAHGGAFNVWTLVEYIAYACVRTGLQAGTVGSHLATIKYYHRTMKGFDLDIDHPLIRSAAEPVGNQYHS